MKVLITLALFTVFNLAPLLTAQVNTHNHEPRLLTKKGQRAAGIHNAERFLKKDKKNQKKSKAPRVAPVIPPVLSPTQTVCTPTPAYVSPAACATTPCYSDMEKLSNDITANLNSGGSSFTATVCSGTYIWPKDKTVTIGANAKLELFCCGKANECIIDGGSLTNTIRSTRLFTFNGPTELNIQGITFQNIFCQNAIPGNCVGSLLQTNGASIVTFKHNTVSNVQSYVTGAIDIEEPSRVYIENCVFSINKVTNGLGGAVYIRYSWVIMKNNLFTGNSSGNGGALFIDDADLEAKCNTFKGNTAARGGAAYIDFSSLRASYNIFDGNVANEGGALYLDISVTGFQSNTFSSNSGAFNGGAFYSDESSVTIDQDIFNGNSAFQLGNNVYLYDESSMIYCNSATLYGSDQNNVKNDRSDSLEKNLCLP